MSSYLDQNGLQYFWNKLKSKFDTKVDKVEGMGLSHNDYDNQARYIVESIPTILEDANATLEKIMRDVETVRIMHAGKVYGVRFDKTNAQCVRLWDAADISTDTTNFSHHGEINTNYDNPFDSLYPWSEFKVCNVDLEANKNRAEGSDVRECVTAWVGDPDFTITDPSVFVGRYRPEYWYTGYDDGDTQIFAISTTAIDGWGHSLPCIDSYNLVTADGANSNPKCCAFQNPITDVGMKTIADYCVNNGYRGLDIYNYSAIVTAYVVEYANMNAQNTIGRGVDNVYRQSNDVIVAAVDNSDIVYVPAAMQSMMVVGATVDFGASNGAVTLANRRFCTNATLNGDNLKVELNAPVTLTAGTRVSIHGRCNDNGPAIMGSASGYIGTNGQSDAYYRGATMYGNKWTLVQGAYRQSGTQHIWLCPTQEKCKDYGAVNINEHVDTGLILPVSNNYIKTLYTAPDYGLGAVPFCASVGGNSSNPVGDYFYTYSSAENTSLIVGGYADNGAHVGPFYGSWTGGSGASRWGCGLRAEILA